MVVWGICRCKCIILILSYALASESLYNRPTDAFKDTVHVHHQQGGVDTLVQATTKRRVELDLVKYKPHSFKDNLKIFHGPENWKAVIDC